LDKEQKSVNKALSRKRIVIEHIFCKLKVFRILRERSGESVSVYVSV
ncbi:hypothetical protein VU05_03920, partial [Desulfobulbus sp. F1]|nr:hypothetical protein [Desulfobulbus sp. F1]